MTVNELVAKCGFSAITIPEPNREVSGAYIGDLLSWVMGRANSGDAWITIMSNQNIVAVATLADVSCIILAENVKLDDEVTNIANSKGINILSSENNAYEIALRIGGLI